MSDWLDDIREQLDLERVYLAGVSNGAYMAYQYTVDRPEHVLKTVCMEGGMVTNPHKTMVNTLLLMFPQILLPNERNLRKIIQKLSAPSSTVFDQFPLLASHLVLLMKSHNRQAMFVHQPEIYKREKGMAVKEKLYFLLGDHPTVVKKEFRALLEEEGFHYRIVSAAGHAINHEQPDIVHRELFQFLLGD